MKEKNQRKSYMGKRQFMRLTGNVEPLMFGRFVETGLHGFDVTIFTYKLRRLVCRRHPDSLVGGTWELEREE